MWGTAVGLINRDSRSLDYSSHRGMEIQAGSAECLWDTGSGLVSSAPPTSWKLKRQILPESRDQNVQ